MGLGVWWVLGLIMGEKGEEKKMGWFYRGF